MVMQPLYIFADTLGHGVEARVVTSFAQPAQICLRVGLVFAFERLRKRDVFDEPLAHQLLQREFALTLETTAGVDRGDGDIVEALCITRAEVEDAGDLRVFEEPEIDTYQVFDKHEVALLTAIGVAVRAFKEFDLAVLTELVEVVKSHGGHAALVRFVRAIDIEVTETGDLGGTVLDTLTHDLIEEQLGVAVHIERCFTGRLFPELAAAAVGGGAGG